MPGLGIKTTLFTDKHKGFRWISAPALLGLTIAPLAHRATTLISNIMKFKLIALLVMGMVGFASAQPVTMGIKGGLNFYSLAGTNEGSYDSKTSFHLGLLGHIHMSHDFALQPEFVFSSQGTEYGNNLELDLDYINVPLLFQYMFDNGFRLQAGPQLGFLVSAKGNGEDVIDNYKTVDFGLSFGASYVHPPSGFGVDARYNHGLTDINDSNGADSYNRGFQVGVFYLFHRRL